MPEQLTTGGFEAILTPLIDVFPQGASAERVRIYAGLLKPEGLAPADVREGVSRLIHVWDRTTFPPFARLLTHCNDARGLRIRVERRVEQDREEEERRVPVSPEVLEAQLAEIRKFRMKVMPEREPDIRIDRETRRKHLGITPLSRDEIDTLNRKRRERERARRPAVEVPF